MYCYICVIVIYFMENAYNLKFALFRCIDLKPNNQA